VIFLFNDFTLNNNLSGYKDNLLNNSLYYKFKDLKSSSLQFLSSERNLRLLNNVTSTKTNVNYTSGTNDVLSLNNTNLNPTITNSYLDIYRLSNTG